MDRGDEYKVIYNVVMQLMNEFGVYLNFLGTFVGIRVGKVLALFEMIKKVVVALLVNKRGRYVRSFAHTTLVGVMLVSLVLAPFVTSSLREQASAVDIPNTENMILDITQLEGKEIDPYTYVSEKPRSTIMVYRVKPGDTLSTIAEKFGISVDTIRWENNLKTNKIKPGQKLRILPVTGVSHRVKKGETVYSIAKKYKTSPQAIVDFPFNYFKDEENFTLEVGQLLIVPDGVKPEERLHRKRVIDQLKGVMKQSIGKFLWPAKGLITQRYHWYHRAIDIADPAGPPVKAAAAGRVVYAGWTRNRGGYGLYVMVDHGDGYVTLYAHLRKIYVKAGQKVAKGQVIGLMGSTGRSTGTHLHFEIRKDGRRLNPLKFYK